MQSIEDLLGVVAKFKPGAPLEGYIGKIRFPNYKNFQPGTEVDLSFPLTVLVGANGSGKSSVLHALYGAPLDMSTRDFWFSTELDPIVEGKGLGPSRYIYSHWNSALSEFVETRKARVRKGSRLDYWEPTKIVSGDGMKPLPPGPQPGAATDRWLPVVRAVVYINFKAEISAFDRYFYFETGQTKDAKHAAMLREAKRLKYVIDNDVDNYVLWNRRRVFQNRRLTEEELKWVKFILGHPYKSATLVRHTLYPGYRGEDISVLFEREGIKYSEAFAGSGEVAVVSSVVKLLEASDHGLILLDEPETSLHPGAQKRFLNFLLYCIKKKKFQVVISTHSPEFLHGLPEIAIKVLEETPEGKVALTNEASPLVAFKRLGATSPGKVRVVVEDSLAKQVVDVARRKLPEGEREKIEVVVVAGGAEKILAHFIPATIATEDDVYVLLDGDKAFQVPLPDIASIAPCDESGLGDAIKESTGVDPGLYLSGGNDGNLQKKRVAEQKKYISWVKNNVFFLPEQVPEEIAIKVGYPEHASGLDGTVEGARKLLYELVSSGRPEATAEEVCIIAGYEVQKNAREDDLVSDIAATLCEVVRRWSAKGE